MVNWDISHSEKLRGILLQKIFGKKLPEYFWVYQCLAMAALAWKRANLECILWRGIQTSYTTDVGFIQESANISEDKGKSEQAWRIIVWRFACSEKKSNLFYLKNKFLTCLVPLNPKQYIDETSCEIDFYPTFSGILAVSNLQASTKFPISKASLVQAKFW